MLSDVDFLRKEIHVKRQVQRAKGKQVEIRPPKYGSERTVYAPEGLISMLRSTSACIDRSVTRTDGCSPARVSTPSTRTRSAAGGVAPGARPG
jgi:hypothetical protein